MSDMKDLPSRVGCALAILFVVTLCAAIIAAGMMRSGRPLRSDLTRISIAIDTYHLRFRVCPPDTGYGLDMEKSPGTYDPGSLWRYLVKPVRDPLTGRMARPFLRDWREKQLKQYEDAQAGPSYYLTDPWGRPYGFVGERKRLVHNKSSFDLFSPGPDGVTACDETAPEASGFGQLTARTDERPGRPNLAYDGLDNDGNGTVDDAAEFGPDASRNGAVGDDINNWSAH